MKKLSRQNIRHLRARQNYQIKRLRWANGSVKRKSPVERVFRDIAFVDAIAPVIFDLEVANVNETLTFINRIKKIGKSGRGVNFILKDVTSIGIGAISMLISVLEELTSKNVHFR